MEPEDSARLSRFIFFSGHFSVTKNKVKTDAFIAAPHQKLSVAVTTPLSEPDVWILGQAFGDLRRPDPKKVLARGDLKCKTVRDLGMTVVQDNDPLPGHSDIGGWVGITRAEQREQAIDLATAAALSIKPF